MAVPKRKTCRTQRDQRRSHDALKPTGLATCPRCGEARLPHRVCPECGWYGSAKEGRVVVAVGGDAE